MKFIALRAKRRKKHVFSPFLILTEEPLLCCSFHALMLRQVSDKVGNALPLNFPQTAKSDSEPRSVNKRKLLVHFVTASNYLICFILASVPLICFADSLHLSSTNIPSENCPEDDRPDRAHFNLCNRQRNASKRGTAGTGISRRTFCV